MENAIKIYSDLVCLHDKVHTYHIRTVNKPGCATLHATLGGIYISLNEIVDCFGENVIIKFLNKKVPSPMECYDKSDYTECKADTPEEIVDELYEEIDDMETTLMTANNKADNCLSQLLSPIRAKFTDFCADLAREMEEVEAD